ncbi:glutamine-hydrolyzing carbamoyl-phosphate synthase small subunit [Geochorda subterranea]|uniref:Carbamoyl phosphate synthase small chain n=1 Tax=Geochorda subterranea TaxID=3109564 RepID=A0ABZ1BMN4_9FIRM|nr:glutamine-hydrolyzing carbamoyl-phosphate synthase small subunit [Limnochorda sp. LNt]WRP13402.1 glutamine-hydrolyzing carbamoyl-phosphate synthase small subunit [Limnochorda sp. LNt]
MRAGRAPAWLALEDGSVYEGVRVGRDGETSGEVVFTTVQTGYQEVLTDPSYRGQIVVFTQPLIGNYGTSACDVESGAVQVRGVVMRELADDPQALPPGVGSLEAWLTEHGVVGIAGVDTRSLVRRLRARGTMRGFLTSRPIERSELVERSRRVPELGEQSLIEEVSPAAPYHLGEGAGPHVVVLDLGVKRHILLNLVERGCRVTVVPSHFTAQQILALRPQGVVISNGPGDPAAARQPIATVRGLLGQVPLFGICLGHQLLGLAMGARTYRMKFGHRGGNHPVQEVKTGRVYITTHNHGYALDESSLPPELIVTHRSLNDGTVEGMRHRDLPAWSVQFHPEATPGPRENVHLFDAFVATVGAHSGAGPGAAGSHRGG